MQSKPKSNSVITHEVADRRITFHVLGAGSVTLDITKLNTANIERAAVHGFIQRISDAAAIGRDPETGKSATPAEKLEAMAQLVAHYESGTSEWSRVRASGDAKPRGLLFQALCIMYPHRDPAEIREWLGGKSKTEQAKLRQNPKVAKIIVDLQPAEGDADAMLDELNDGFENDIETDNAE